MAALAIEEESGTSAGWTHPHNGYHAGHFSRSDERTSAMYGSDDRALELVARLGFAQQPAAHLW